MSSYTIVLDTEHCPKRMIEALFTNLSAVAPDCVPVIWSLRSSAKALSFNVPIDLPVFRFTSKIQTLPVAAEVARGKYAAACAGGFLNGHAAALEQNMDSSNYILVTTRAATFSAETMGLKHLVVLSSLGDVESVLPELFSCERRSFLDKQESSSDSSESEVVSDAKETIKAEPKIETKRTVKSKGKSTPLEVVNVCKKVQGVRAA